MKKPQRTPGHGDATQAFMYCRVSSAGQEDNSSLGTQEERCRTYAAERGWTVVGVYREIHTGAELFERPQLTRLREALRAGEAEVVLAYALDRVSRNQAHLGFLLSEWDHRGVRLALVSEDLDDTPEGRLLHSVRGFVAEMERLKIAERTVRGRRARAQAGKLLPGKAAVYGYRWRDETKSAYAPDPEAGPIVQRIFREAFEAATIRSIACRLTAEGISTPSGGRRWSASTLHTILKRRAYIGEAIAWRYGSKKIKGGGYRILIRPEHEQITLPEGTIPPLVEPAMFDAVQHRLERNREQAIRNNRTPESSLLRGGYGRCGYCGTALNVTTKQGSVFYRHGTRTRDCHGCPSVQIKVDRLDVDVWRRVEGILTQPQLIAAQVARLRDANSTRADIAAIDRQLEAAARKQGNLIRRLALIDDEDMATVVAVEVNALAAQRRQLEGERATIEATRAKRQTTRDQLTNLQTWCRRVAINLEALAYGQKREILDALGVRVQLYHTNHQPRYQITASLPLHDDIASIASSACVGSVASSRARRGDPV